MRSTLFSQLTQYWPRLPFPLRLLGVFSMLAALVAFVIVTLEFLLFIEQQSPFTNRGVGLAPAFGALAFACMWAVIMYTQRFRSPEHDGGPAPVSRRVLIIVTLILATPPLAALVCAMFISPVTSQFGVVFFLEMFSGYLLFAAYIWAMVRGAKPIG